GAQSPQAADGGEPGTLPESAMGEAVVMVDAESRGKTGEGLLRHPAFKGRSGRLDAKLASANLLSASAWSRLHAERKCRSPGRSRDDASRRYRPKLPFLLWAPLASVEPGIRSSQFGAEQEDLTCI